MTHFLRKAFDRARHTFTETYHQAGFAGFRLLTDDDFLLIQPENIKGPRRRKAAELWNILREKGQDGLYNFVTEKNATGNLGPKPDYKKPALKLAEHVLTHAGKSPITGAVMFGLTVAGVTAAAFGVHAAIANSHMVPDVMSAVLGSNARKGDIPQPAAT